MRKERENQEENPGYLAQKERLQGGKTAENHQVPARGPDSCVPPKLHAYAALFSRGLRLPAGGAAAQGAAPDSPLRRVHRRTKEIFLLSHRQSSLQP